MTNKKKLSVDKFAGFHRFKQLGNIFLLTNDAGSYCFLSPDDFANYQHSRVELLSKNTCDDLTTKGFIRNRMDFDGLIKKFANRHAYLGEHPSLHIVVLTMRCDHRCTYCQAGATSTAAKGTDMTETTVIKVVDRIFESTNHNIVIEFQGGEPLLNFKTLAIAVKYARQKNKLAKKKLILAVVSNLSFMDREKLDFFVQNNVAICTSLDGPGRLHQKQRLSSRGSATDYKNTIYWIKYIRKRTVKKNSFLINALATITKNSLRFHKEIIDTYTDLGLQGIHLRPVNPFGVQKSDWKKITFKPAEFLDFYTRSLDYIIHLNRLGNRFFERTAVIFLKKILSDTDPNFLDLRSPCGAGTGQLAYNFNGDVYACDEARMLGRLGNDLFMLGNVFNQSLDSYLAHDVTKTIATASCLDNIPGCSHCVYKPYCGVCPIYNYAEHGDLFRGAFNNRCMINSGILDYLFKKLQEGSARDIFSRWIKVSS